MQLENKIALVTGGNRGIGAEICLQLANRKAHIIVGSRECDPAFLAKLKLEGAKSAIHMPLDLSSKESTQDFLHRLALGKLEPDLLVNNAGVLTGGLLERQALNDIYQMFQVNLIGLVHLTHGILPFMIAKGEGKIVNNASVSGVYRLPGASTYAAAKSAVIAFTACLRQELAGTGVGTLAMITPGVRTRMFDEISKLYGSNYNLSFLEGAVDANEWAERVILAIENDQEEVSLGGLSSLFLWLARSFPKIIESSIAKKFHR